MDFYNRLTVPGIFYVSMGIPHSLWFKRTSSYNICGIREHFQPVHHALLSVYTFCLFYLGQMTIALFGGNKSTLLALRYSSYPHPLKLLLHLSLNRFLSLFHFLSLSVILFLSFSLWGILESCTFGSRGTFRSLRKTPQSEKGGHE